MIEKLINSNRNKIRAGVGWLCLTVVVAACEPKLAGDSEAVKKSEAGQTNSASASQDMVDKLLKDFPSIYWQAADACLRETSRSKMDFPQTHDEFVNAVRVTADDLKPKDPDNFKLRLRLQYPEDPDKYWLIELAGHGNQWVPVSGEKFWRGKKESDLFEDEYLLTTKVMGSMKPYFEKVLKAYSDGQDISLVFPKKQK